MIRTKCESMIFVDHLTMMLLISLLRYLWTFKDSSSFAFKSHISSSLAHLFSFSPPENLESVSLASKRRCYYHFGSILFPASINSFSFTLKPHSLFSHSCKYDKGGVDHALRFPLSLEKV